MLTRTRFSAEISTPVEKPVENLGFWAYLGLNPSIYWGSVQAKVTRYSGTKGFQGPVLEK
jgi:hypothetical protein